MGTTEFIVAGILPEIAEVLRIPGCGEKHPGMFSSLPPQAGREAECQHGW